MAKGQPGFADSMFNLANQRQAALSAEQARVTSQEGIRRRDIDKLSGFNASEIVGDQQRMIFEEAVTDVQSYISGTGEYEGAEYDPVNFRTQVAKISSLYNGFKGHNEGDAKTAQASLYDDAYSEGGQEIGRENGVIQRSNNTPTSYDEAVASHNDYFETAKTANGKTMYDENGHPMGYPVIDGEVDYSASPTSMFKMEAYANPTNFKGNTVEQAIPSLYDMSVTAQAAIQQKQGVIDTATGALQPISEVSNDYFDNAINNPDFLDGAIRDIARVHGDELNITDEQMKAYINGEKVTDELGGPLNKILDSYVLEAREEWGKLTAYGRSGGSAAESPFTGNSFESAQTVTTATDDPLFQGSLPQEDSISNVGYNINPLDITSPDHGNYQITGIMAAAQGSEGGEGQFVMIPQEVEMLRLPDGEGGFKIIPMGQATEDQLTALEGGRGGYSTIDVTQNEMVRIDGENADPRAGEIWDNLRSNGVTENDFIRNQAENVERFQTVRAEREVQAAAQADVAAANADVLPQETTEVGGSEPLPDDPAAAADLLENDSDATPEEKEAANARAEEIESNSGPGGLLSNLMTLGPLATFRAWRAGEAAQTRAEENRGQGEEATALRERLLAEESAMLETEAEALRETTPTPLRDSQEIEENVLSNFALNSPERELAEEVINSTPPASTGINDLASNPDSNTNAIISDMEGVLEGTGVDEDGNPVSEMDAETVALIAAEDTAAGEAHSKAMQVIISKLGGVDFLGDENIKEFNDQVRGIMEHVMGEGYMSPGGGWSRDVEAKRKAALNTYVSKEQKRISKGKKYNKLSKKKQAEYDGVRAKGEEAMAAADPGRAGGSLNYDTAPNWCAAWVSNIILNKNPEYDLNKELAVGMESADRPIGKTDDYDRLRAKSFQTIGETIFNSNDGVGSLDNAQIGDIITRVNSDGGNHVGFYAGIDEDGKVLFLGGNQNDSVNVMGFDVSSVQSVNRIQLSGEPTLTGQETKESLLTQEEIEAISSLTSLSSGSDR